MNKKNNQPIFVHTFWSVPLFKSYFNNFETSLKTILLTYAFSAELIHKWGYKIKLFADDIGAKILNFIPYDEVVIIDKFVTDDTRFAAQIKFEALKQCSLEHVLIDGDLFLRKNEAIKKVISKKADVVCSFLEPQLFWQTDGAVLTLLNSMHKTFKSEFKYDLKNNLFMCNTSLIKLNNQELKDQWIEQYFRLLPEMQKLKEKLWLDLILEQIHLTQLAKNYSIGVIADNFPNCNDEMLELGFTHLGDTKSHPDTFNWIKSMCAEYKFDILPKISLQLSKILL